MTTVSGTAHLPQLDAARDALRRHVLAHSLKTGNFTLKSGKASTWFLDTKQTACRPDGIVLVADVALSLLPDDVVAIGGLTMGADPVAFGIAAVAATRGRSLRSFSVRKEAKDHGITGRIAGALQPGDKVAIVEDTVTRGTSIFDAVTAVREFGATPVFITVIVDRGGTCADMASNAGIAYEPMLTAPQLGYDYNS
ncbi:MAG: orotate phosphoribosyltransferase [Actinobacteria bacterium]|nr:orotate phosphoribosyltransferase [Actinomycetota bacterium]